MKTPGQVDLFAATHQLPPDFIYREELITRDEEAALLGNIAVMPLQHASYRQWTAKRRVVSFGGSYDFTHHELLPAEPIPTFLYPLRERMAGWAAIAPAEFGHATIAEYSPGTQLGWHRDVPDFEIVAGVSLQGMARMRFRPYPPVERWTRSIMTLDLPPRSAYIIRNEARWKWQHAISPTKEMRYSITFRTLRS